MEHSYARLKLLQRWLRRHWLIAAAALFLAALTASAPTWAAPVPRPPNQTVPRPTPTSSGNAVATATPRPDDDDDGGQVAPPVEELPTADPSDLFAQPPGDTDAAPGLTARAAVGQLNVRSGPGPNFSAIGSLSDADTVGVVARSANGDWWLVCCLAGANTQGWVNAELMTPDFDRAQAGALLPVSNAAAGERPTATPAPASAQAAAPAVVQAAAPLILEFEMDPPFLWQGAEAIVTIRITNPNDVDVQTVALSDELPAGLTLLDAEAGAGGAVEQVTTASGRPLLIFRWPTLPAGTSADVTLTVQVDDDLDDGAVIDNLVAVRAANAGYVTGALTIGMPPVEPPAFD